MLKIINFFLIDISFDVDKVLNIENARELIVYSSASLLDIINNNSGYEKYFETMPIPLDLIRISIFGKDLENKDTDFVRIVSIVNGEVSYDIENEIPPKEIPFSPLITIHEETLEEAQRILTQANGEKALKNSET